MLRPDSADVPTHRMLYPNRKPLLISAILVALTSVPTLVVVAAGTVSLDSHRDPGSTAVGAPSDAPVIIEPGASAGLSERPSSAGRAVQAQPVVRQVPRVVASFRGTGPRLAPAPPTPAAVVAPVIEDHVPSVPPEPALPGPPLPEPSLPGSPTPTDPAPSTSPGPTPADSSAAPPGTPVEPRIDDRAWPGWDAHLPGG